MLSTAFLMTKKKENFDENSFLQGGSPDGSSHSRDSRNKNYNDSQNKNDSRNLQKAATTFIKIFILLLILDIAIIIFGLYCLFSSGFQLYVIIPILILMFIPAFGTAVAIVVIVYHFATKNASKPGAITTPNTLSNAKASFSISPTYQFF
jgi:NADH:ubiquinone oxidoreductase subunit 3 (subunit A)